ncbi:MAG: hypothetical protein ACXAC5_06290 [Promethearchaeota archaeon]
MWYSPGMEAKAGRGYLEIMKKYPPDSTVGTIVIPFMVNSTPEGTHTFTVTEVKEGKLEQAIKDASRNMLEFGAGIEGLKYQIRTYLTAPEGMSIINLGMPDV